MILSLGKILRTPLTELAVVAMILIALFPRKPLTTRQCVVGGMLVFLDGWLIGTG
ncbi:MAG TPA: hypothetical protein VLU94_02035 [Candidatus Nitrosotalea sp.]|nr:hypothetical protein [Candidatus Nitrosotalea sp.]